MNNTEDAPGEDLRQQAAKETANAIARMKTGAASVDGSEISSAIRHIARAVQVPPPPLNELPGIRFHYPRRPEDYEGMDVARWVDLGNTPKPKPSLLRRVLGWFRR